FLTVERHYLEDVGVDFDFSINTGADKKINRGAPVSFSQSSFSPTGGFTSGAALDTGQRGNIATSIAPSLVTSLTYIDDFQLSFLIRATQAQGAASKLTAPRLTLYNGQRAYILVATNQAYVSDLQPVVGSNS